MKRIPRSRFVCFNCLVLLLGMASLFASVRASVAMPPTLPRVAVDEARRQAKLLHQAMHSTLQIVHHRYYRLDEGQPLPASVMKEIFEEIEKEEGVKLRWLVVEGKAMNTDHNAADPFEMEAVKRLKSGDLEYEENEGGVYRRAAPITLSNQCLKCHVPDRKNTANRVAGLIVTIPGTSTDSN